MHIILYCVTIVDVLNVLIGPSPPSPIKNVLIFLCLPLSIIINNIGTYYLHLKPFSFCSLYGVHRIIFQYGVRYSLYSLNEDNSPSSLLFGVVSTRKTVNVFELYANYSSTQTIQLLFPPQESECSCIYTSGHYFRNENRLRRLCRTIQRRTAVVIQYKSGEKKINAFFYSDIML